MDFRARQIAVLLGLGLSGLISGCLSQPAPQSMEHPATSIDPPQVVALGRLGPIGGVIKLSVPNAADSRVNQMLVQEGDRVEANQVIAILQGSESSERDLAEAVKTVELFEARLAQVKAGTSNQGDLAVQQAEIYRLQAQLTTERAERESAIAVALADFQEASKTYQRQSALAETGAISKQALDQAHRNLSSQKATFNQRQAALATTEQTRQAQLLKAEAALGQLQEVRPVDIQVAQTELERARLVVEQRQAALEDTRVRVPIDGQILRINTKVGEQVNIQQGIAELGKTDEMYALAEVYETQIGRIQPGQPAKIRSEYGGFEGEILGRVESRGLQVGSPRLRASGNDPANDENTRVVDVRIRIDPADSEQVSNLTNLQVRVEIDVSQNVSHEDFQDRNQVDATEGKATHVDQTQDHSHDVSRKKPFHGPSLALATVTGLGLRDDNPENLT